jgi:hypothetical protein
MIASYLAAAIALTMIASVALGQSPSPTTASPYSSASVASERSATYGNGVVGQFWTSVSVQSPKQSDDVPKTVEFGHPVVDTASR